MKKLLTFIVVLLFLICSDLVAQRSPIEVVKSVADKIISECEFDFKLVKQVSVLGVQILDFDREFSENNDGSVYALSYFVCDSDTNANFGVSSSNNISIWINDELVKFKKTKSPEIEEVAYGMINFFDTISVRLNKGENKILIKAEPNISTSKIFIRQITDDPETAGWLKFTSKFSDQNGWMISGPYKDPSIESPETLIKDYYLNSGEFVNWRLPKEYLLRELKIDDDNIFRRDSYADWNYANGETIWSILNLSETAGDKTYYDFVKQWCDFIIQNIPYFQYQYDSLNALRGSYHRIFRKSMLDDAGAPVLPFAHLLLSEEKEDYSQILKKMADYVFNEQVRLKDGTFCRPEPVEMTVWADDLFMSVPLLLKVGKITGEKKYFNDATKQILNFNDLLFNGESGLYKHGWFSKSNETSVAFWGRANGWVMWALSEALLHLPKDHENYNKVMNIYRDHVEGLIRYQDKSGMWHQVLDHPESYEETSCTAMFILGIARGVNNQWLDDKYKQYALKGWHALKTKIENGVVYGICRGTGIGYDLEFYFNRPTFDNDPRGLGAVLTAGIEISMLK